MSSTTGPVRWDLSTDTDPVCRSLALAGVGLLGGLFVAAFAILAAFAVLESVDGNWAVLAGGAVVVAVGVAVNRAQFAALRTQRLRTPKLGRLRTALALAGGAVVHAVAAVVGGTWLLGPLLALGVLLVLASALLTGEGTVDPATGTVEYAGEDLPLDSIRSVRSVLLGDRVVVLLRYYPGEPTATRLATFSEAAFTAAEPSLRPAESPDADDRHSLSRPVRVTAAVFAVGIMALSVGFFLLAPPDVLPLATWMLLLAGVFAVIFGWYAVTG
ncbi:hypothetical protein [Halobaculum marinum]|uniref:PH domain-containing protein n=1 Tax=Halobaculum marinum TaxID=3031996 RepID=A0ABD5WYL6_9EURY|nr:hypothetical protein [Halobaculum sp. DT55]